MPELIAIDLPGGTEFVATLRDIWDAGDAAMVIDRRLPPRAQATLVDRLGPSSIIDQGGSTPRRGGWPIDDGDAIVVATSGTTGESRGVILTHDAVASSTALTSAALQVDPDTDRWLACLPLSHIGGLSVVTRALLTDTPVEVHDQFDAARCEAAAAAGATLTSLVVTALTRTHISGFRWVLLGGSAIPEDRPENTVATYGMTETGSGVVYDGWPLPGVELEVIEDEILIRSPTLMRAYRDESTPIDDQGWLHTGDSGALDDSGRLSVHGRIADVIVTGGEKVWPVVVEGLLARQPWVERVMVVGRPDPEWGQRVTAVVVVHVGAEVPAIDAVRDALSDDLPRYALPQALEIVTALPETSSGKVIRNHR